MTLCCFAVTELLIFVMVVGSCQLIGASGGGVDVDQ